jgi:hypothetical protein
MKITIAPGFRCSATIRVCSLARRVRVAAAVFLLTVVLAGVSTAGIITLVVGQDDGAAASDPRPNSNAAAVKFDNLYGPIGVITFENLKVGPIYDKKAQNQTPVDLGFKTSLVQLATTGSGLECDGICGTDFKGVNGSYNTTSPGKNYLRTTLPQNQGMLAVDVFSFADPITSFGFFYTGTQAGLREDIKVAIFENGVAFPEVKDLPLNNSVIQNGIRVGIGGVGFFGVSDSVPFSKIEIRGDFGGSKGAFGIDDVRVRVNTPEPATIGLVGIALVLFGALRRRLRSAVVQR